MMVSEAQRQECLVYAFLLQGKVQRRYVESAGRHYRVGGYVINTEEGHVFGEAWVLQGHQKVRLDGFVAWIRGEHTPAVYTNIKPTPVGTAYPELARVDDYCIEKENMVSIDASNRDRFIEFTMIRGDQEASMILSERRAKHRRLLSALNNLATRKDQTATGVEVVELEFGAWPKTTN